MVLLKLLLSQELHSIDKQTVYYYVLVRRLIVGVDRVPIEISPSS